MLSQHVELMAASGRLIGREPFAIATVVAVHGSSAAKPGAKMLVRADGMNVSGWVGGGCAESFVLEQAVAAMQARQPRQVSVDLEDEVLGVGMPCGGRMDVFIEPVLPLRRLRVIGDHSMLAVLAALVPAANLALVADDASQAAAAASDDIVLLSDIDSIVCEKWTAGPCRTVVALNQAPSIPLSAELAVRVLAEMLALDRRRTAQPLRVVKGLMNADAPTPNMSKHAPGLLVVGHNRVSEALAQIAALLDWPVCICASSAPADNYPKHVRLLGAEAGVGLPPLTSATCAVVATQHKGDHLSLARLLASPAPYVGLIASSRRTRLVLDLLQPTAGVPPALYAPAGLDIGTTTPFEIALSIAAEIIGCRYGPLTPALTLIRRNQAP